MGLVAWVVVVTIALVAIAAVAFRRWRRQENASDTESIVSGSHSSGDMSDVSSVVGMGADHDDLGSSGLSNSGFEPDAKGSAGLEQVRVHMTGSRDRATPDVSSPADTPLTPTPTSSRL